MNNIQKEAITTTDNSKGDTEKSTNHPKWQ